MAREKKKNEVSPPGMVKSDMRFFLSFHRALVQKQQSPGLQGKDKLVQDTLYLIPGRRQQSMGKGHGGIYLIRSWVTLLGKR